MNGKKEIQDFIYDDLLTKLTKEGCPHTVNIQRAFRNYLSSRSPEIKYNADELAEKWHPNLCELIESVLKDHWDGLGIPRPISFIEDGNTLVTWTHPKFSDFSGFEPLTNEYFKISDWLTDLNPQEFLIPCACFLFFWVQV